MIRRFFVVTAALIRHAKPFHLMRHFRKLVNKPNFLFLSPYPLLKSHAQDNFMENFDMKLKEACDKGDAAIEELMELIKNKVNDVAKSYKECLKKQIEIMDVASKAGATSATWDDLPKYRTLAKDLSDQFQKFVVTVNTIGEIARNETLQYITQQKKQFQLLAKKHEELDKIVQKQIEEIKKLENTILIKSRDSIQKTK